MDVILDEWTLFWGVSKMKVSRSISSTFQSASSKFRNLSIWSCYWQRHWSRSSFFRDGIKRSRCISLNRESNFAPPCFPGDMMEVQRLSKGFKFSKDLSFCYWVLSLVAWSHIPTAVRIDFYVAARGRKRKRFKSKNNQSINFHEQLTSITLPGSILIIGKLLQVALQQHRHWTGRWDRRCLSGWNRWSKSLWKNRVRKTLYVNGVFYIYIYRYTCFHVCISLSYRERERVIPSKEPKWSI